MLREAEIKTRLVDLLVREGAVDGNAVLISEMVSSAGDRRVDLALVNGHLHGFEIKSDVDTLSRLKNQVKDMLRRFEAVSVVTTERHLKRVRAIVPKHVGIFLATQNSPFVRRIRRPKQRKLAKVNFIRILTAGELRKLLRECGARGVHKLARASLDRLAMRVRFIDLRYHAIERVKDRFRYWHARFFNAKRKTTCVDDLSLLKRGSNTNLGKRLPAQNSTCNKLNKDNVTSEPIQLPLFSITPL